MRGNNSKIWKKNHEVCPISPPIIFFFEICIAAHLSFDMWQQQLKNSMLIPFICSTIYFGHSNMSTKSLNVFFSGDASCQACNEPKKMEHFKATCNLERRLYIHLALTGLFSNSILQNVCPLQPKERECQEKKIIVNISTFLTNVLFLKVLSVTRCIIPQTNWPSVHTVLFWSPIWCTISELSEKGWGKRIWKKGKGQFQMCGSTLVCKTHMCCHPSRQNFLLHCHQSIQSNHLLHWNKLTWCVHKPQNVRIEPKPVQCTTKACSFQQLV